MNPKKFSEAMNELDARYIEEAMNYKKNAKKPVLTKLRTIAACIAAVAVIVGAGVLWKLIIPTAAHNYVDIYFLTESGAMESKSVVVQNAPADIFDEWAAVNNVSDVSLVDCVYDAQGIETERKDDGGECSTLLLTVSSEFSAYMSNKDSAFLIETLRRTFYDNNNFDNMILVIESLTNSAASNGIAEPDMQADDGKALVWEGMSERIIDGIECYSFELRFSDDEEKNGEMAGRLWGIYAVSNDGTRFYRYNMADDTWEQLKSITLVN